MLSFYDLSDEEIELCRQRAQKAWAAIPQFDRDSLTRQGDAYSTVIQIQVDDLIRDRDAAIKRRALSEPAVDAAWERNR